MGSLEPVGRFPETLRSGPVGFQLGHHQTPVVRALFTTGWPADPGRRTAWAALTSFLARSSSPSAGLPSAAAARPHRTVRDPAAAASGPAVRCRCAVSYTH